MSHYKTLGIPDFSSIPEVEAAYSYLVKYYDPSSSPNPARAQTMKFEIAEAYAVLSDATRKKFYDEKLRELQREKKALEYPRLVRRKLTSSRAFGNNAIIPTFVAVFVVINVVAILYFMLSWINDITHSHIMTSVLEQHLGGLLFTLLVSVVAISYLLIQYYSKISASLR